MSTNVKIPSTRTTSREGVNATQTLFESNGCIFQEVAQQNDFGKDAYVDIAESGIITHLCVAVQIKSGESFRLASGDYFIPVENHAENWRRSTVPVFGIVYDPTDRLLRWTDLTGHLRANPHQESGRITVRRSAVLNQSSLRSEFSASVSKYASDVGGNLALRLLSGGDLQADAVFDAWALGRHDARHLILLRRLIAELQPIAIRKAIVALSHAAPHPDIFWHRDNWIPQEVEEQVQQSFRWSPEEIAHMIRAIDISDWGRGTLGQSFDVLMYEDPKVVLKLHMAVGILLSIGDFEAAVRCVTVALSHSKNAHHELALFLKEYPELANDEWFIDISAAVQEWGGFSLY